MQTIQTIITITMWAMIVFFIASAIVHTVLSLAAWRDFMASGLYAANAVSYVLAAAALWWQTLVPMDEAQARIQRIGTVVLILAAYSTIAGARHICRQAK